MANISGSSSQFNGSAILEFERPMAQIEQQIHQLEKQQDKDCSVQIRELRSTLVQLMKKAYGGLKPWEKVQVARHPNRPQVMDYIQMMVRDFCELHGDRQYRDDLAIVTGFGRIAGQKCMVIGNRKGKDTKEKIECYFGCAHPEGYRKALAKMKLAEKFNLPIVCLIDTPGAYPGIGAEERGIARAIAVNLMEMSRLATPVVCIVIAEGGSGGALGIGVGDRIAVMQHAYYSVISPEGCAAILWKSAEHAPKAAECLKLTPIELKTLGLIDDIVKEPLGAAHRDPMAAAAHLERYIGAALGRLTRLPTETLLAQRYEKLRKTGQFFETAPKTKKKSTLKPAVPTTRKSPARKTIKT